MKSEKTELKSNQSNEETIGWDFMVKVEVEAEQFNIQNFFNDDDDENQSLNVENQGNLYYNLISHDNVEESCQDVLKVENQGYHTGNLYYNLISHDNVEESSQDGSFKNLQEFCLEECMICHGVFMSRYHLIKHKSTHLRILVDFPKTYQCDYCSVYFTEKRKLVNHIYFMHCESNNNPKSKKKHPCTICKKQYTYKNWHEHITSVHGNGKYECTMCNVRFKCLRYLKTHNRYYHTSGHKPEAFQCNFCPKKFNINDCLNKHIKNCHGSPAQCDICKSKLKSVVYLKTHMRRVHYNDGKVHKCNICSKKFKSPRYVRVHIKNTHAKTLI